METQLTAVELFESVHTSQFSPPGDCLMITLFTLGGVIAFGIDPDVSLIRETHHVVNCAC